MKTASRGSINRPAKVILVAFLCALLSACAFGTDRVKIHDPLTYKPAGDKGVKAANAGVQEMKPVSGEKIGLVLKRISDNRTDISKIGAKKNTYGMETGKVDVEEGVVFLDLFTKNLIDCLEWAGYEITPLKKYDGASQTDKNKFKGFVEAEIRTFWTTFMPGFFTVDAVGDVIFEVRLYESETSKELWSEMFRGKGTVSGVAATRGMYEESINIAYSEAMKNFFSAISDEKVKSTLRK